LWRPGEDVRGQVLVKLAHAWASIAARRFVIAVVLWCT